MSIFEAKKVAKTYSRQRKRPLYDEEPPTKRRRVEDTSLTLLEPSSPPISSSKYLSPTRDPSDPRIAISSEPPAIFSDEQPRSSPPSSPVPRSSPPVLQKRRPVFSIFKKQKSKSQPLAERSHNAQTSPKQTGPKKEKIQMQLDLATSHRKTCKQCGMEYIPSNAEDVVMHRKFHSMNLGGVDFTKAVVDRLRKNQIWSSGDGSFITVINRKDATALRNRASEVLKVVTMELGALPITEEELWSRAGAASVAEVQEGEPGSSDSETHTIYESGSPLVDRFKMYLYVAGNKCIGACLAERIWESHAVLSEEEKAKVEYELPVQSSSISIGTASIPAILGVSRIWTSNEHRKKGIATRLLDSARSDFLYGMVVEKKSVAFSQPTESGGNLARKWFGRQAGWSVYIT